MHGGCLVIFPAGGVSTTPKLWDKRAVDTEWKTFTARLITQAKAPVAPVFFAGQNSRLFQLASHVSMTLQAFAAVQGSARQDRQRSACARRAPPVPFEQLPSMTDRQAFMGQLREMTYALGRGIPNPPKTRIKRPRSAPKTPRSFDPRRSGSA